MNTRMLTLVALLALAFTGTAQALAVDLASVAAMPLAVADVSALPSVPMDPLMTVIATLNRAAVPAPQFIEVVRYAPVALVQPADPPFATYVSEQYDSGVVGEPLALAIDRQYDVYGISDANVVNPPVITRVVERQFVPQVVVTRFQPVAFDPLALVAMPLAVAAVADLADVPQNDLFRFVTSLNRAMVPAPQFVEVVRYSPVLLIDREASPRLTQFVTTEIDRGVVGSHLAFAIAEEFRRFAPVSINVVEPRPFYVADRPDVFIPPLVVDRVARTHPHGGPPGQLKKQLGLQTGAQVVHGAARHEKTVVTRSSQSKPKHAKPHYETPRVERPVPNVPGSGGERGNGHERGNGGGQQGNGHGNGGEKSKDGHGNGHGKGKG